MIANTLNTAKYARLVAKARPVVIRTKTDYNRLIGEIDELVKKDKRNKAMAAIRFLLKDYLSNPEDLVAYINTSMEEGQLMTGPGRQRLRGYRVAGPARD